MATGANISNRISLDGGDDIKRQLATIADAAETLFKGVKALSDQFGTIDASKLDQTRGQLQQTGQAAAQGSAQVQGFGSELLSFAGRAALGITALAVAVGGIISSIAKSAADSTSALQDSAQKLGLTLQTYQALKKGADDAGISVEGLNRILGNIDKAATQAAGGLEKVVPIDTAGRFVAAGSSLQQLASGLAVAQQTTDAFGRSASGTIDLIQKFGDSTVRIVNGVSKSAFDLAQSTNNLKQGAKGAADALAELGISASVLSKLTPDQRLQLISAQLDKIPEGAGKAALAAKLFGEEWRKAIEFIKQLPNTLTDSDGSLRAFSDSEIAAGKKLKDSLSELGAAFTFLKDKIGLLFAPGQTARAEWLTGLIDGARKLLFGFIAADDAKKKLLEAGKFDLFQDLDLDKFQEFLNQAGETGLAKAIGFIRDVSRDLATLWTSVLIPAGQVVIAAFNGIAEQINSAFGTEISGRFVAIVAAIGLLTGAFGGLRAVFSPVVALFGFMLTSIGSLAPLLLAGGLAIRAFWAEFRASGTAAVGAVRAESAGFFAAFSQLARGNLSGAWALFKSAALDAFASVKEGLGKIFGGEGSSVFTTITRLISGVALAASGLAAIFNSIFGTNLNAEGLLLVAVLAQLTGAFGVLRAAAVVLGVLLTPVGLAFAAITASAIILARQFPDLGKSWELVTQAFSNLLNGEFSAAFGKMREAFSGVWDNLKKEGVLTWAILGAGAIAFGAALSGVVTAVTGVAAAFALLALNPIVAALIAAAIAAAFITEKVGELIGGWDDAKTSAEKFDEGLNKLKEGFDKLKPAVAESTNAADSFNERWKSANAGFTGTTKSLADSFKSAFDQIKAAMSGTSDAAKQEAGKIVPPFNDAAGKITDGFKSAAQQSFNGFKELAPGVWQKIEQDGKSASEKIASSFNKAADGSFGGFKEISRGVFQKITQDAKESGDKSERITDEQWKEIVHTVTQSLDDVGQAFATAGDAQWKEIVHTVTQSLDDLDKALATVKPAQLTQDLSTLQQGFAGIGQSSQDLTARINDAFTALQSGGSTAASQLQTVATSALGVGQAFDGVGSSASSEISTVTSSLDGLIAKLSEAASAAAQTAAAIASLGIADNGGLPAVPFAAGGFTGAGGTFEPAGIVHKGEYVQPAHVVRQPGVLAFMEMLRSVGGDLRKAFAGFGLMPRGFSIGGLVDSMSRSIAFAPQRLSYAVGGLVNPGGGLHPVTIDLGGGHKIAGMFAPPDSVRQLQKEALLDQMRSKALPSRGLRRG